MTTHALPPHGLRARPPRSLDGVDRSALTSHKAPYPSQINSHAIFASPNGRSMRHTRSICSEPTCNGCNGYNGLTDVTVTSAVSTPWPRNRSHRTRGAGCGRRATAGSPR